LLQTLKQWERWKPRIATKRGQRKLTHDLFLQGLHRWFSQTPKRLPNFSPNSSATAAELVPITIAKDIAGMNAAHRHYDARPTAQAITDARGQVARRAD
jgi:hypothetical protein